MLIITPPDASSSLSRRSIAPDVTTTPPNIGVTPPTPTPSTTTPQPPIAKTFSGVSKDGLLAWELVFPTGVLLLRSDMTGLPVELRVMAIESETAAVGGEGGEDRMGSSARGVRKVGKATGSFGQMMAFRIRAKAPARRGLPAERSVQEVIDEANISKQTVSANAVNSRHRNGSPSPTNDNQPLRSRLSKISLTSLKAQFQAAANQAAANLTSSSSSTPFAPPSSHSSASNPNVSTARLSSNLRGARSVSALQQAARNQAHHSNASSLSAASASSKGLRMRHSMESVASAHAAASSSSPELTTGVTNTSLLGADLLEAGGRSLSVDTLMNPNPRNRRPSVPPEEVRGRSRAPRRSSNIGEDLMSDDDEEAFDPVRTYIYRFNFPLPSGLSASRIARPRSLSRTRNNGISEVSSRGASPDHHIRHEATASSTSSASSGVVTEQATNEALQLIGSRIMHHPAIQPTLCLGGAASTAYVPTVRPARVIREETRDPAPALPTPPETPGSRPASPTADPTTRPRRGSASSVFLEDTTSNVAITIAPPRQWDLGLADLSIRQTFASAGIEGDADDADVTRSHVVRIRVPYQVLTFAGDDKEGESQGAGVGVEGVVMGIKDTLANFLNSIKEAVKSGGGGKLERRGSGKEGEKAKIRRRVLAVEVPIAVGVAP